MRYKLLGPSGLRVSEIALGSLTFGESQAWGADARTSRAILGAFADAGGTLIDTAPNYANGAAEEIIGDFVAGNRDDFVIATKFTAANARHILAGGNSRKSMVRSVEASLKRLQTDYIDLLWLHYWDGTTPMEEILRGMEDLRSAGKLLYTGFSDTPAWLVSRAVTLAEMRGEARPVAIQGEYNIAARDLERELLPMADGLDLGVLCWGPMAAGALAGGSDPRRRSGDGVPGELAKIADQARAIADEAGLPVPALALRWLLRHPARRNLVPIVGARLESQLKASLEAATGDLDETVLAELDALAAPVPGFPHSLINSRYLRKLALGQPEALDPPARVRC